MLIGLCRVVGRASCLSTGATMRAMRILLVEDDAMIGKAVQAGLGDAGFTVDWVQDGRSAEVVLANREHDLAILDLGLPKKDGMTLLSDLRAKGNTTPVLIA